MPSLISYHMPRKDSQVLSQLIGKEIHRVAHFTTLQRTIGYAPEVLVLHMSECHTLWMQQLDFYFAVWPLLLKLGYLKVI